MTLRIDKTGPHRSAFDKNKKRILKTQNVCGICGKPVDKKIKYPNPMSPVVDHIVPIAKNGHPSDIKNLQLAHFSCNIKKSDKIFMSKKNEKAQVMSNRDLPQTIDWSRYTS